MTQLKVLIGALLLVTGVVQAQGRGDYGRGNDRGGYGRDNGRDNGRGDYGRNECAGEYYINANNTPGNLSIRDAGGGRITGTVTYRGNPPARLQGSCDRGQINFELSRNVDGERQQYEGSVSRGGMSGRFYDSRGQYQWSASRN